MADAMLSNKDKGSLSPADSITSVSKRSKKETGKSSASTRKSTDKRDLNSSKKGESSSRKVVSVEAEINTQDNNNNNTSDSMAGSKEPTLSDVMNCLQSLRTEQTAANCRMDSLSAKVDEMYSYDYIEQYEESDGDDIVVDNVQSRNDNVESRNDNVQSEKDNAQSGNDNVQSEKDDNNNEHPSKKQRTSDDSECSIFKNLGDKYKIKEKVDKPVDKELAEMVNSLFRSGLPDEKFSEMVKSIHRPENCEALTKTRVNQLIWNLLKDTTKSTENRIQFKQNMMIKAACLITKMLDKLNILRNETKIDEIQDIIYLGTDALGLLGHCNRVTNMHRREMHRPDLSPQYVHLASSAIPYTSFLYGDDVSKNVSDIDSINKVGNKIRRGGFGWTPGGRGRSRGGSRGGRGNRGGRSRGGRKLRSNLGRGRSYHNNNYMYDQDDNETTDPKNFRGWYNNPKKT